MVRIRLGFKILEVQFFFLILKEASFINTILSPNSQSSLSQKTALPYQKYGHGPQFCTLITVPQWVLTTSNSCQESLHLPPYPLQSLGLQRLPQTMLPSDSSQMWIVKEMPGSCLKALWLFPCVFRWKPTLLTLLQGWCAPLLPSLSCSSLHLILLFPLPKCFSLPMILASWVLV